MFIRALLLIMVLVSNAYADGDALLNLVDPANTSPLGPTLRIQGQADGGTNTPYKLPILPCVVNTGVLALTDGRLSPCYVNALGQLITSNASGGSALSTQDTGNSTLVPLGGGATFTGTGFDLTNYAGWSISVFSDVGSATNGWVIQWSEDNVNWGGDDSITYVSGLSDMAAFGRKARYVRVVYTNGVAAQATFRVYAWGHVFVRQTRHFIGELVNDQDTGQIVIATLQGHTTAGGSSWVPVKVTPSGALAADVTQAATSNPWTIKDVALSSSSITSVNDTNLNTTLLASNTNRLVATIYNDSDQILYVKLGVTASTTSFTAKVFPDGYYEVPKRYVGQIDGIWAADSTGAARITELTP